MVRTKECAVALQLDNAIDSSSNMVIPVLPSVLQQDINSEMYIQNPVFVEKLWSFSSVVYLHFLCGGSGTELCQKEIWNIIVIK